MDKQEFMLRYILNRSRALNVDSSTRSSWILEAETIWNDISKKCKRKKKRTGGGLLEGESMGPDIKDGFAIVEADREEAKKAKITKVDKGLYKVENKRSSAHRKD